MTNFSVTVCVLSLVTDLNVREFICLLYVDFSLSFKVQFAYYTQFFINYNLTHIDQLTPAV